MANKNSPMFDALFREKPVMMLITLSKSTDEMYASTLAKAVDCTYSHVVKVLQEMHSSGLVSFKKQGRLKILSLTKKGEKVASGLSDLASML